MATLGWRLEGAGPEDNLGKSVPGCEHAQCGGLEAGAWGCHSLSQVGAAGERWAQGQREGDELREEAGVPGGFLYGQVSVGSWGCSDQMRSFKEKRGNRMD